MEDINLKRPFIIIQLQFLILNLNSYENGTKIYMLNR